MVFGGKKWKIWPPGQIDPKGTHPLPKHVFGCTERKSTLLRVSCGRIEGTKKNNKKKHARVQLHPYAQPTPHFRRAPYFACVVALWTCQISSESVQGFPSPRWPKMTISHWLGTSRSKKLLVQLNVSLLVAQSKLKPSKREIRLPRSNYSPRGTCGYLLVIIINWLAKRKSLNDFTVYFRNMI